MVETGPTVTLNDGAEASNPGLLRVNYLKYARSFPLMPAALTLGLLVCLVAAPFLDLAVSITVLIAAVIVYFLYWKRVGEHFWHGCVCPAVVVSDDPYRVAVSTDLTTGVGEYPVIKVLGQPLGEMTGGPPKPGTPLATVALYSGNVGSDHWDDFEPKVINCVSTDQAAIERVLQGIPEDEWQALQHGLAQLSRPLKPGLYPVEPM